MTWTPRTLDELGSVSRGRSRHRPRDASFLYGGSHPFIQTGDVKAAGLYIRDWTQTYSDAGLAQSKKWPVGTLCITIAANIAETGILEFEACFPDSVIGFIADSEKSDARFVKYLFDFALKRKFQGFSQGAAQDNLSQEKLLSIQFPVPEVSEQTRLADVLARYDELIENNQRRIKLLEEAARLIYREWFVRLRFPSHQHTKIDNGVPEGWHRSTIANCSCFLSRGISPTYDDDALGLVINQKCIRDGLLDLGPSRHQSKKVPDSKLVQKGDVLVNSTGAGTLGRVAQMLTAINDCTVDSHVTIVRPREELSPTWFGLAVISLQTVIQGLGKGATNQTELSKTDLGELKLIVPSERVASEFEELLSPVRAQIQVLRNQCGALGTARELLMPRLMSGGIEI